MTSETASVVQTAADLLAFPSPPPGWLGAQLRRLQRLLDLQLEHSENLNPGGRRLLNHAIFVTYVELRGENPLTIALLTASVDDRVLRLSQDPVVLAGGHQKSFPSMGCPSTGCPRRAIPTANGPFAVDAGILRLPPPRRTSAFPLRVDFRIPTCGARSPAPPSRQRLGSAPGRPPLPRPDPTRLRRETRVDSRSTAGHRLSTRTMNRQRTTTLGPLRQERGKKGFRPGIGRDRARGAQGSTKIGMAPGSGASSKPQSEGLSAGHGIVKRRLLAADGDRPRGAACRATAGGGAAGPLRPAAPLRAPRT